MTTGRTVKRYLRIYSAGYDLSGYARNIGPLSVEHDAPSDAALTDPVKNALCGNAAVSVGALNGFFDNTALVGLHAHMSGAGVKRTLLIVQGMNDEPAQGDPAFAGEFTQLSYQEQPDANFVVVNIPFGNAENTGAALAYENPWGVLLNPVSVARTAVNAAIGVDNPIELATAYGGFMCYQLLAVVGTGSVTLKVQDAATNTDVNFVDLSGASSGAIAHTLVPSAGIIALGRTATVRRYLRWQLAFTTITSATFALSFHRAYG